MNLVYLVKGANLTLPHPVSLMHKTQECRAARKNGLTPSLLYASSSWQASFTPILHASFTEASIKVFAKFLYFKKRSQGGAVQLYTMEFMFFPKYVSACDVLSGW